MADQTLAVSTNDETLIVRRSITIEVGIQHAFDVFTHGFGTWWPTSHHIGAAELADAIIEPRVGGRFYERGVDGTECDWGYVLAWEPPHRLLLAWQLDAQWRFDPTFVCEVEVTFAATGPDRTRVQLEHRNLDRYGAAMTRVRKSIGSNEGWSDLLRHYARRTACPTS